MSEREPEWDLESSSGLVAVDRAAMDAEEQAAYALYVNRELADDAELADADVLPLATDGSDLCDKCRCVSPSAIQYSFSILFM